MFARFDENPAMTLQDIKETKRYGRTDGQRENSIPTTNKVCGGIINITVIPVLSSHSKEDRFVFKNGYRLIQVESIAECSRGAFCNTFDLH